MRDERGFTLVELLAVMVITSLVFGGLITAYLSGVRTSTRLTADFRAQTALHLGMDKLRADTHLACAQTAQSATSVTLSLPPAAGGLCSAPSLVTVTWCTQASGSTYSLYRVVGATCVGGYDEADYLTSGSIFTYTAQNTTAGSNDLPRLHVDVTLKGGSGGAAATSYRLVDDLVFENGPRT